MTTMTEVPGVTLFLTSFQRRVMDVLIEAARAGRCMTYKEVATAAGRPEMLGHWLANTLGDISKWCHKAGMPLLSAIVVSEHSEDPGEGFWRMVDNLYRIRYTDGETFLRNMQAAVFAFWRDR